MTIPISVSSDPTSALNNSRLKPPIQFARRDPTSDDTHYPILTPWVNENTLPVNAFVYLGAGVWEPGASGTIDILTGDSGSAFPAGGIINILAAPTGLSFTGASNTLTLGGALNAGHGGLGITTTPTNGQIPIGNGTHYVAANITSNDGTVTIRNGAGTIDLSVSGDFLSLGAFGSTPNADGLSLTSNVLNMQPADGTHPGGVSILAQTFAGVKTFSSAPILSSLTGVLTANGSSALTASTVTQYGVIVGGASNALSSITPDISTTKVFVCGGSSANPSWQDIASGALALAAFGSTPNADGASLSGATLTLQPASGSQPGGVSTGSQTFAGTKTFSVTAFAPNFSNGQSLVTSAGSTTVLTINSNRIQQLRGTLNQSFQLPDATSLQLGFSFEFNNNSSGTLTVVANDGVTTILTMTSGSYARVSASSVSTTNGTWDYHWLMPSTASFGTAGLTVTGSIAATTSLTSGANSGTNGSLILNGSTSGTVTVQPQAAAGTFNFNLPITAGTSGYFLTSAGGGSSPMTWTQPSSLGYITTINGDSGSITASGNAVTIKSGTSTQNCGSSVNLTGSASTLTMNVTDANDNTMIGLLCGNASIIGSTNTALGWKAFNVLGAGGNNTGVGQQAFVKLTSGSNNTGFGTACGDNLLTGQYNLYLGYVSGSGHTSSESSNINLNNAGTLGDSNVLRIGAGTGSGNQQLNKAFISGINGVTASNQVMVTINSSTDQLGTLATTGTGNAVLATSPTLVTPVLGTPSSGTLTSCTGLPLSTGVTGTLGATNGGTAQSTYATGDVLYASATNTLSKLGIGTNGYVLTVSSGVPSWQPAGAADFKVNIQVITTTQTYTATTGTVYVIAEIVGSGGGGGGAGVTGGSTTCPGAGGGGGAYARGVFTAATISGQTVTIGAGGSGGTGASNGSNGNTTSIGTLLSAGGGTGGASSAAGSTPINSGGNGGSTTGGSGLILSIGGKGGDNNWGTSTNCGCANGGSSFLGNGGTGRWNADANPDPGYGGGGGGAANTVSVASTHNGATGGNGIAVLTEYIFS